jgi:two-component system NtrC family response regulator
MKPNLLIIEDEPSLAKQLKWGLSDSYEIVVATDAKQAGRYLGSGSFPVTTLDLGLPPHPDTPVEGFRLLESLPSIAPHTKVIVITGNAEQENAVKSVALGATDFCAKPVDLEILKIILDRTFRIHELEEANRSLRECSGESMILHGMVGVSAKMESMFRMIRQVSPTDYPVLIQGESGTGKEMVARAIHALSRRNKAPLVIINCAAIPENLLESELFGHEKGSFTGAVGRKIGKFEQSEKGTLFLDEIGDMSMDLQAKLLRFLQEGTIERVGGTGTIILDVRIIAATNVDMEKAVRENRFREDLFYRLNVVPIVTPPLSERREDILLLAHHFIREESRALKRGRVSLSPPAAATLTAHSWPGNVRELQNRIRRAMATTVDGVLTPANLGLSEPEQLPNGLKPLTLKEARDTGERLAIQQALAMTGNNISHAAKLLGVSRPTLHDLLKKHGMG